MFVAFIHLFVLSINLWFQLSFICLFWAFMFVFSSHSFVCSQHWCLFSAIIHLLVLSIDAWFQQSFICLFSSLIFSFSNHYFACSQHLRLVYTYRLRLRARLRARQVFTLCQWKRAVWRAEWVLYPFCKMTAHFHWHNVKTWRARRRARRRRRYV